MGGVWGRSDICGAERSKGRNGGRRPAGFTLIEVLIALLIFAMASIVAVNITQGAVRAVRDSKERSVATWLLQSAMAELETRLETEGIDKGCEKKKEGKFTAPYEQYSYTNSCYEVDFHISEAASKLVEAENKDEKDKNNPENMIKKMILDTTSEYITKALRELHTEVSWMRGNKKQAVTITTHYVRYDQPLNLPLGSIPTGN